MLFSASGLILPTIQVRKDAYFHIEDNEIYARTLHYQMSIDHRNEVEVFSSGEELFKNIYRRPDLITLDYQLPDMNGIDVLRRIKMELPGTPVIASRDRKKRAR